MQGNGIENMEENTDAPAKNLSVPAIICRDRAGDTSQRCGHSPAFLIVEPFQDPDNMPEAHTPQELGQLIIDRGFSGHPTLASFLTERVNYGVLLQYCRAIEKTLSVDNSLSNMHDLLCFDRDLRSIIMKWIGVFEERFRAKVANEMALRMGSFAHRHPDNFKDPSHYDKFKEDYEREVNQKVNSNDDAVTTALKEYGELPIWVAVEVLSFGSLSKLFRNLKNKDVQHAVSDAFRIPYGTLSSWLRTLAEVRNRCAHSTPLVCRPIVIKPKKIPEIEVDNGSAFYAVLMLMKLTEEETIHADMRNVYELGMVTDVVELCKDRNPEILAIAGFPSDWKAIMARTSTAIGCLKEMAKAKGTAAAVPEC